MNRHLSCPCQTEHKLLTQLLEVFDAYVYNTYLQLKIKDIRPLDFHFETLVNNVYDTLMTLLSTYQKWWRSMEAFKADYMTPIMRRIQGSPWIQREIEQMESTIEAARQRLSSDEGNAPGLVLHGDQVKAATQVAERRAKSSASKISAKTRFKREHTI